VFLAPPVRRIRLNAKCHRRAFEGFGAVPQRRISYNAECAEGYGFRTDPCPPCGPQKKGIVESGVKYVKDNFLAQREFRNLCHLNEQAVAWVTKVAGVRSHGRYR